METNCSPCLLSSLLHCNTQQLRFYSRSVSHSVNQSKPLLSQTCKLSLLHRVTCYQCSNSILFSSCVICFRLASRHSTFQTGSLVSKAYRRFFPLLRKMVQYSRHFLKRGWGGLCHCRVCMSVSPHSLSCVKQYGGLHSA